MKNDSGSYYDHMIASILDVVVGRTTRHASEAMFIDTKFSTLSGADFPDNDPIRGRGTIYTWIQGRGMEALAAHDGWLDECQCLTADRKRELRAKIRLVLENTVANMEAIRRKNGGRLFFMMSASGVPLTLDATAGVVPLKVTGREAANMSELFYVKGLASAARLLGQARLLAEACAWYERIHADIMANRFYNDQQCLDPKNLAVTPVPGRRSHGPKMIALGAAFRFLDLCPERKWLTAGLAYLDYILANHVNLPAQKKAPFLHDYAFWEFIDEETRPWADEQGRVFSDPGHALEFVGLAYRFLASARTAFPAAVDARWETSLQTALNGVLTRNFPAAFSAKGFGICKSIDLATGRPINSDLPWWNLPETMRAASFAAVNDPAHRDAHMDILRRTSDAFRRYYVRPELNQFAYQTLDADGRPVDAIPGTPDADPGYHTSLSLIDVLRNGAF